ncbi:hypothetical protein C1I98_10880 [Spongiactinospora gelatinilytica]|uniref:Glycosyl hydrolase family 98 putative carbohydrate-binding module domain-containing protein n=1 Tax=Spongiactinospora gelatinilytica TaxID=2666298 RepID=A0A2W2HKQ8_9ACTN|nr:hypothetical protein C1I98_10880 [Spongiactinospora gelatinilytica]
MADLPQGPGSEPAAAQATVTVTAEAPPRRPTATATDGVPAGTGTLSLTELTPKGDGLVTGTWSLAGKPYSESLAAPDMCSSRSTVIYELPRSHQRLVATAGIDDDKGKHQGDDAIHFAVYVDRDHDDRPDEEEQVTAVTAQYGKPASVNAPIGGATAVILTMYPDGCVTAPAVWGSPPLSGEPAG